MELAVSAPFETGYALLRNAESAAFFTGFIMGGTGESVRIASVFSGATQPRASFASPVPPGHFITL